MAESVDALVSNTSGAIRAGSTPALGTKKRFSNESLFLCVNVKWVGCENEVSVVQTWVRHVVNRCKRYAKRTENDGLISQLPRSYHAVITH